jgi:hypothetical protein
MCKISPIQVLPSGICPWAIVREAFVSYVEPRAKSRGHVSFCFNCRAVTFLVDGDPGLVRTRILADGCEQQNSIKSKRRTRALPADIRHYTLLTGF